MKISHNGKTIQTEIYKEISQEEYENLKKQYYEKPPFEEVKRQMIGIANGQTTCNKITNYYVKDLMAKVKIYYSKWSIEELLNCKELVEVFVGKIYNNDNVFPKNEPLIKNFETILRIGSKGYATKPANFPIETVQDILNRYNINNNWYDYSCGWGDRLLGALYKNCNYYGTDPNYMLVDRLKQMAKDYQQIMYLHNVVDIRPIGSEEFVEEWVGKMGLAFSSPPYFALEDYKIGKQSYNENVTYEQWKNGYLKQTMLNIHKYLIDNGYFILNINNYDKYMLVEDCIELAEQNGFKFIGNHILTNIQRINSNSELNDNSEKILVFMKKGHEKEIVYLEHENDTQLSLFD